MRAPRTPLTTEFRGGYRSVRGRLENLFCPNARRRGGRLIAVVALLAGLSGSLVACQTDAEVPYGVYAGDGLVCQFPFLSYRPSQASTEQWRVTLTQEVLFSTFPEAVVEQAFPTCTALDFEEATAAGFAEYGAFAPDLSSFTDRRAWSVEGLGVLLRLDDQLWLALPFPDGIFLRVYRLTPATDSPMRQSTLAGLLAAAFSEPDPEGRDTWELLCDLPGDGCTLGVLRYAAGSHAGGFGSLLLGVVDNRSHQPLSPAVELRGDDNRLAVWTSEGLTWLLCTGSTTYQGVESGSARLFTFDGRTLTSVTELPESARVKSIAADQSLDLPTGAETMFDPDQSAGFWAAHKAVPIHGGLDLYAQNPDWRPDRQADGAQWEFFCTILLAPDPIPDEGVVTP